MENLEIKTSQNISLEYEIAGLGDRIIAFLIDALVRTAYVVLVIFIMIGVETMLIDSAGVVVAVLLYLPVILYHLLFEIFMNGSSIGKNVRNIRVMRLDGIEPTIGNYFIRWIFRIVDIQIFSGLVAIIAIASSKNGQRIGDMVAGTTVVRISQRKSLSSTSYRAVEEEHYRITFTEAEQLTASEAQLIAEVLQAVKDSSYRQNIASLLSKTREKISQVYTIQSSLNDREFLETLLRDYNYIHGRS